MCEFRRLVPSDLEAALALELVSYSLPWSVGMFASELGKPEGCHVAAEIEGYLCGYLIAGRLGDAWHVMNVVVDPRRRRRGIASQLLEQLFSEVDGNDDGGYTLEVRASNTAAIALYERSGFRSHGLRRGYYVDNDEDAAIMWRPPQALVAAAITDPDALRRWEPVQ